MRSKHEGDIDKYDGGIEENAGENNGDSVI